MSFQLHPRFNLDDEAEFWVMPDENFNDGMQALMADGDEVRNFFEFEQELNEFLIEEIDEPSVGFEVYNDFENEDGDASIV